MIRASLASPSLARAMEGPSRIELEAIIRVGFPLRNNIM
jgi:hypothetical protein